MDLSLDSPPVPAVVASAYASNLPPVQPSVPSHPSYFEMITTAISALGEQEGSSKRAIANYIQTNFSNLPPSNAELLTHHLKRLQDAGQVTMVKHSYKLSKSGLADPVSVNESAFDSAATAGPKKRPGRPPKTKSVPAAVPVFGEQSLVANDVPVTPVSGGTQTQNGLGSIYISVQSVPSTGEIKRGRGRPSKQSLVKSGLGHPAKGGGGQTGMGRGRGRPRKSVAAPVDGMSKPRGRPRKLSNVDGGEAAVGEESMEHVRDFEGVPGISLPVASEEIAPVTGKRRGRPPKAGSEVKKPRILSGKPLGRPKKNALAMPTDQPPENPLLQAYLNLKEKLEYLKSTQKKNALAMPTDQPPENPLLQAYLNLKEKLEYLKSTLKRTVSDLKPDVNSETAMIAVQELENLATMDVGTTEDVQPQS